MLTKAMIRKKTYSTSFDKGEKLYQFNKVTEFSVEEDEEIDYIIAKVKGSGRNQYEVTVDYDIEADKIVRY